NSAASNKVQMRNVFPQQQLAMQQQQENSAESQRLSKVTASEAEFRQLVGDSQEGTLARFLQDKLHLMFWYRPPRDPQFVFGSQLDLTRLTDGMRDLVHPDESLRGEIALTLLDDMGRPVAVSPAEFRENWKHPFAATEMGEALPHWEVAVYLLNPAQFSQAA